MNKLLLVLVACMISISSFAIPGTYTCYPEKEYNFLSTDGLLDVNVLAIEFTVPAVNPARVSDINDVYMEYDFMSSDLIAQATTRNFGEYGKIEVDIVESSYSGFMGGISYSLGLTQSGFSSFSLVLPKMAKNIGAESRATLLFRNNLRNIMTDLEMVCSKK